MRDDVHVDVAGLAGHGGAHARPERVLPGAAARGAQHDLGGVHPAGELQQRRGHVVADHLVVGAAQLGKQPLLPHQRLGGHPGQPVPGGHVHR
ncbi:hypothetical protein, partial [Nocardiopsis chromatogenes]|uniref:hypothetical protein n=1 Tax=Nocardiopsis chromatogenes TaxID=280239 RepID=UPI00373AE4F8